MYHVVSKTQPRTLFVSLENRAQARAEAKRVGGTVKTDAEFRPVTGAAGTKPSIMELAQGVAKSSRKRSTVGKKEKVTKRQPSTPAALAAGEKALAAALKAELNKVGVVRAVSQVAGLQRRDVIAIVTAADLDIAPATISTQFQLVRSGKGNK